MYPRKKHPILNSNASTGSQPASPSRTVCGAVLTSHACRQLTLTRRFVAFAGGVGLFLSFLAASPAAAYTARTKSGCTPITFASPPDVVVHTAEMSGFDLATTLQMLDAVVEIHEQLNAVGGTSAAIASVSLSTDPFVYQSWFGSATPTIHVGFRSDPGAAPASTDWNVDAATCNILEAHIAVKNPDVFAWRFTEPSFAGEAWYLAGLDAPDGRYFRIAYMHELLHAFGLAHSADGFAMLNYGERPWANRPEGEKIKPLPDDIEGLRDLYPAATTRNEIAVLNTWFDPAVTSTGAYPAAFQFFLCSPAIGTGWAGMFDPLCAITSSASVCPGDTLYTRVAVANYGSDAVDVDMNLWLSTDDELDRGVDLPAAQTRSFSLGAQSSSQQGRVYTVPNTAAYDTDYFVIVEAEGTQQVAGGVSDDWIPLRDTVHVLPAASCP